MKNIFMIACTLLCALGSQAQCTNGDFALSTFSGWNGYINTAPNTGVINTAAYTPPGIVTGRHTLETTGVDMTVGGLIPKVLVGPASARLGNNSTGAQSEILSYTFNLTQDFSFMYALVFQDAHDDSLDNPFFCYWISTTSDLATSTVFGSLLAINYYRADATPFYQSTVVGGTPVVYKQWTKECVMNKFPTLYSHLGETVTIYFATADCAPSGHFGYAYIDELCKPNNVSALFTTPPTFPYVGGAINVDATGSLYENEYYYTSTPWSAPTGGTAIGATVSTTVRTGTAGVADIRPWFPAGTFIPTPTVAYFKITLYVRNCNGYWAPYSRIVQMLY